jgi:predicted dehydrogenase
MTRRDLAALSGFTASALGFAANETLHIGCLGAGGRCRHLLQALAKIPGVRVAAVCDVWERHREMTRALADPRAFVTGDFRAVLDRKDIDAVLIASPDHWHVPMTIASCEAGKDVYVEKPLTHKLAEGRLVIDACRRSGRIVQVGMQQRSMPHVQRGHEIIRSGALGKILKAHLTWNRNAPRGRPAPLEIPPASVDWDAFLGNAPPQPFDPYRLRNWRWFWDFGGGLFTDLMVHWIDVVHWCLDLDHPAMATSIGDHMAFGDLWETPDTVQTLMRYPKQGVQVYFEGTFSNQRNAAMIEFMGTEGTLYVDRGRIEVIPERKRSADGKFYETRIAAEDWIIGEGPRGADFYAQPDAELLHLTHWLECVRSRKQPNTPVEAGVSAASAAHLANLALRSGQVAQWPGE